MSIPKIGAVNLHPAVLPAYRGPNVFRMFYDDWHEYGITIHWMDEDFDTGNILSQASAPMPKEVDVEKILTDWMGIAYIALEEGMEKAIAGAVGTPQDNSQATYAAPFTEEERWLDWSDSRKALQLKHMALTIGESDEAKAHIDGKPYRVKNLETVEPQNLSGEVGQILIREDESLIIQVGDGALRIQVEDPETLLIEG
jgi:methionyl-tRNA formyltransferase